MILFLLIVCHLNPRTVLAQCRIAIERARLNNLDVTTREKSFSINLDGVPVVLTLENKNNQARIQVTSPMRFWATIPKDKLSFRVKEAIDLYGGRIHLGKKAIYGKGNIRDQNVELSLKSTLGIDVKQPLRIHCSHIHVSDGTPYTTPRIILPPDNDTIGTGSSFFPLYVGPNEIAPLYLQYPGPFRVLDKKSGWILIEAAWEDGSKVRGWTLEKHTMSRVASLEGWGEGVKGKEICGVSDYPYLGKFTLRENAAITASPGGSVWARVTQKLTVEAHSLNRSDGWIRVVNIPGFPISRCSESEHFWVHASDVIWSKLDAGESPIQNDSSSL